MSTIYAPDPFTGVLINTLLAMTDQAIARASLTLCDWSDEFAECMAEGTIHHIASERDLCPRHYQMAVKEG